MRRSALAEGDPGAGLDLSDLVHAILTQDEQRAGRNALSGEALSKREREVVAELQRGGRVPTIAKSLAISPTTVRNHLQRIFWKLGVHSQAELIEYVQSHPETLGGVDIRAAEADAESIRTEGRYWKANARLADEIDAILETRWGPAAIHDVFHRALPLAPEGREEWRARLAVWSREDSGESELGAKRAAEMENWRRQASERIVRAQDEGWVRSDLTPETILEQLFSLLVGVALQILVDPRPERPDLVRVVDAFVDDLLSGPAKGEWRA
jgi:DNA-binding CsgD family transcriptional regulator